MNRVIMTGRLTKDPEFKYTNSNEPIGYCRFSVAVPRKFKRENEPDVDFISCVSFGKTAEFINKYFSKGKMIGIDGRIQTGSYTNKSNQKVYTTDVLVESAEFCGDKPEEERENKTENEDDTYYTSDELPNEDDLPF